MKETQMEKLRAETRKVYVGALKERLEVRGVSEVVFKAEEEEDEGADGAGGAGGAYPVPATAESLEKLKIDIQELNRCYARARALCIHIDCMGLMGGSYESWTRATPHMQSHMAFTNNARLRSDAASRAAFTRAKAKAEAETRAKAKAEAESKLEVARAVLRVAETERTRAFARFKSARDAARAAGVAKTWVDAKRALQNAEVLLAAVPNAATLAIHVASTRQRNDARIACDLAERHPAIQALLAAKTEYDARGVAEWTASANVSELERIFKIAFAAPPAAVDGLEASNKKAKPDIAAAASGVDVLAPLHMPVTGYPAWVGCWPPTVAASFIPLGGSASIAASASASIAASASASAASAGATAAAAAPSM